MKTRPWCRLQRRFEKFVRAVCGQWVFRATLSDLSVSAVVPMRSKPRPPISIYGSRVAKIESAGYIFHLNGRLSRIARLPTQTGNNFSRRFFWVPGVPGSGPLERGPPWRTVHVF